MEAQTTKKVFGLEANLCDRLEVPRSWDIRSQSIDPPKVGPTRLFWPSQYADPRLSLAVYKEKSENDHYLSIGTNQWIDSREFSRRFGVPANMIGPGNLEHILNNHLPRERLSETLSALDSLLSGHPDECVRTQGLIQPVDIPAPFTCSLNGETIRKMVQIAVKELCATGESCVSLQHDQLPFLAGTGSNGRFTLTLWRRGQPLGIGRTATVVKGWSLSKWQDTALKIVELPQEQRPALIHSLATFSASKLVAQHSKKRDYENNAATLGRGEKLLQHIHTPEGVPGIIPPGSALYRTENFTCLEMPYYPLDLLDFIDVPNATPKHQNIPRLVADCKRIELLQMAHRLASALRIIHSKGVLVFDVKHANILVRQAADGTLHADFADLNESAIGTDLKFDGSDQRLERLKVGCSVTTPYCCAEDLKYLIKLYQDIRTDTEEGENLKADRRKTFYRACQKKKDVLALGVVLWNLLGLGSWSYQEQIGITWTHSFGNNLSQPEKESYIRWANECYKNELGSFFLEKIFVPNWKARANAASLAKKLEEALQSAHSGDNPLYQMRRPQLPKEYETKAEDNIIGVK